MTDARRIPANELTEVQANAALKRLAGEIGEDDRRYHREDRPTIADAEYDALRARNSGIEKRFLNLVRPDSPSRRIGAAITGKFQKVRHAVPVLWLDNTLAKQAP
jgi:DNA ligase (NAD+)